MGSSREARRAGHNPKMSPTAALKPNASSSESAVTAVCQPANRDSIAAVAMPRVALVRVIRRPSVPMNEGLFLYAVSTTKYFVASNVAAVSLAAT